MKNTNPEEATGIILSAGRGSRLFPITKSVSKQLLPIFDKPLIYYPLTTLLLMGIRNILIVVNPDQKESFENLLGDGSEFGVNISYKIQEEPHGLADAFNVVGEKSLSKTNVLILGDNILYGSGMTGLLSEMMSLNEGATIFGIVARNLQEFGVPKFKKGMIEEIIEKPEVPPSEYAIPGLYIYDQEVLTKTKALNPSARGELEITDLNNSYLRENKLKFERLPRGVAWFDSGTNSSLLAAANFISSVQEVQNILIGSPHEVAYKSGFIDAAKLNKIISRFEKSNYGAALKKLDL